MGEILVPHYASSKTSSVLLPHQTQAMVPECNTKGKNCYSFPETILVHYNTIQYSKEKIYTISELL